MVVGGLLPVLFFFFFFFLSKEAALRCQRAIGPRENTC